MAPAKLFSKVLVLWKEVSLGGEAQASPSIFPQYAYHFVDQQWYIIYALIIKKEVCSLTLRNYVLSSTSATLLLDSRCA